MKNAILFSISSGIGYSLALKLLKEGYCIYGTYNTFSNEVQELQDLGVTLYKCNLLLDEEVDKTLSKIVSEVKNWECLVVLQASMNPIGKLLDINMQEWEDSIKLNFINNVKIIKELLPSRTTKVCPSVISFAGGGTNNATENFSAYTISKISLIKMTELLYAEYYDTKFTCIGPGWVDTKIHQETIKAKENATHAYNDTITHINDNNFTKMNNVIDCILWIINSKKEIVSGRNFSVVHDDWGKDSLNNELLENENMYKLRREGNKWNK